MARTGPAPRQMKRVALSSLAGSAIEFYDFVIYGTAAALVFPTVFFPHLGTTMATVAALGTFAVAFFARPVGAAVFGHYGDRLGRKTTLVATMLIMGLSTVGVGLVPSSAAIGFAAPLVLLILRLLQGFALGGEWAGSALLTAEHAPPAKRGAYGMFPQVGMATGLVAANLMFLGVNSLVGQNNSAFMAWGWRVPFLLSAVLLVIALYVRLKIDETPVFTREFAGSAGLKMPIANLLTEQRREVVLASGCVITTFTLSYMAGAYLTNYASAHLGYPKSLILSVGVLGGLVAIASGAVSAVLCDSVGRRRILLLGFAAGVPWSFAVLPLVDSRDPILLGVAIIGTYAIIAMSAGPLASFIPEIFATRYRYTGAAVSYNVGGIVGGALPPILAAALLTSSWAIGVMMALLGLISLVCVAMLPETLGRSLTRTAPLRLAPARQLAPSHC